MNLISVIENSHATDSTEYQKSHINLTVLLLLLLLRLLAGTARTMSQQKKSELYDFSAEWRSREGGAGRVGGGGLTRFILPIFQIKLL